MRHLTVYRERRLPALPLRTIAFLGRDRSSFLELVGGTGPQDADAPGRRGCPCASGETDCPGDRGRGDDGSLWPPTWRTAAWSPTRW